MMEPLQLPLLTDDGSPTTWPCTACRGTGEALRLLYPSEREPGGPFVALRRCAVCNGTRRVDFDPDDYSVIPF